MVQGLDLGAREIRRIVVDRCGMPQERFIEVFPPNALNLAWIEGEVAAAMPCRRR